MLFMCALTLPSDAEHVHVDERDARERLTDASGPGAPELDRTADELVLRWGALEADSAWAAALRMAAVARLLVPDFEEHAVLRVSVDPA